MDVFLESCAPPATHLLDLGVQISHQGEGASATAVQGMCVDSINWYSFCIGVV